MNAPSNLPAERKELPPLVKLGNQLEQRADEFRKALPSHISPDKLQRTIITAAQNNPDLLTADRQSLITSCMKAAQDGLLPDGREAALVIFNTREKGQDGQWYSRKLCQYMPMVYGLRKKITQSGEVVSLQTGLVYRAEMEAGAFIYEVGMEPPIRHRPMLDLPDEELTDDKIVAAYSIAKMKDGTVSAEVMRRGEINKVREASNTGATRDKKGNERQPKGPWVDWFGEMARKTVMRRHSKTLPMSGDVILDVEGRELEAAASAARVLSVEADKPVTIPSRDDLATNEIEDQSGTEAGVPLNVDPETGEVFEQDAAGRTVEDEETARALDANDGTLSADNPTAAEGPADEDRGEAHVEYDDKPAWFDHVAKIRAGLAAAKTKTYVAEINAEYEKSRAALPDDVVAELDGLVTAARKRVQNAEV
jgi:recombination protein RecT